MIRSSCSLILAFVLVAVCAPFASAGQGGLFPLSTSRDSLTIAGLVQHYLTYTEEEPIPYDSIAILATDELRDMLKKSNGVPPRFPKNMPFAFAGIHGTSPKGDRAIAVLNVDADTVPMFGSFTVNWVFFARRDEHGVWQLSQLRRQMGLEAAMAELRFLDTSSVYPRSLKPIVARESGSVLLSNAQLRALLVEHREQFRTLAGHFLRRDSLRILGRNDRMASQINRFAIGLGDAAQEIPEEAVKEYMATATPAEQEVMRSSLKAAEVIRRRARDTVQKVCRKLRLNMARVDSAVALMHDVRVTFVNAQLPWKGAVQFTVGGRMGNVAGLLYSPKGELPFLSPEEYFYLEDLGEGWWIFRAT